MAKRADAKLRQLKGDICALRSGKQAPKGPKNRDRLTLKETNVKLESDFNGKDILSAIDHINTYRWSVVPPQLNSDFTEHINKFRSIVPPIVTKSQLYSLFLNENSFVDQQCNQLFKDNKVKIISIAGQQFITCELTIKTEDYIKIALDDNKAKAKEEDTDGESALLSKFVDYITKKNFSIITKSEIPFTEGQIATLVKLGYLSLMPTDVTRLSLSLPKLGFVVKLLQTSSRFVHRTLNATKWKELPLKELTEKYAKNKARFSDLKGIRINWTLNHLIGEGRLEMFESFDGEKAIKIM